MSGNSQDTSGRSDNLDRPLFKVDGEDLSKISDSDLDQSLERHRVSLEKRRAERLDRWERWQQYLVLTVTSTLAVAFIVVTLAAGINVAFFGNLNAEISRWWLETAVSALVAVLVSFLAVRTFDRW